MMQGGLSAVNIPVGILPGDGAAGNGSHLPQAVVAHGQGSQSTFGVLKSISSVTIWNSCPE